jgi:hypothetical protein
MPPRILIEEFHLSLRVRATLSEDQREVIRTILKQRSFQRALRQALRAVQAQFPGLQPVHWTVSV